MIWAKRSEWIRKDPPERILFAVNAPDAWMLKRVVTEPVNDNGTLYGIN